MKDKYELKGAIMGMTVSFLYTLMTYYASTGNCPDTPSDCWFGWELLNFHTAIIPIPYDPPQSIFFASMIAGFVLGAICGAIYGKVVRK